LAQLAIKRNYVWAQLAYAFDTAFQRFLRRFTQIIAKTSDEDSAVEKARHTLHTFMKDDVGALFIQVPYGHLPDLALPTALKTTKKDKDTIEESEGKPTQLTESPVSSASSKLPHHKTGEQCYSCPRYQTTGKCRARCKLAHCPSGKLPPETHDEMDTKIKAALEFFKNN
jgi:hypothetical protein